MYKNGVQERELSMRFTSGSHCCRYIMNEICKRRLDTEESDPNPEHWESEQETERYPLWKEETNDVWYAGRQVSIMNQGRSD